MQNKPLNVIMAELLAKLDEKPPVEEGALGRGGEAVFDFLRGLGKGTGKYGGKTGFDAFTEAVKAAQKEADEALVKAAMQKPKITPAEIAAARAEGITTQEWLIKNKPEFYATLEKAEPAAQEQFFNLVRDTAAKYPEKNFDKQAMAISVTAHIIALAIAAWKTDKLPTSSSSSSSSSSGSSSSSRASSSPTSKGTWSVAAQNINWEELGAPGYKGSAKKVDGKWSTMDGTPINDAKMIASLEAALQKQLSTPMTVQLITQADADKAEKQAKLDKEVPITTSVKDSPVKVKVDPKRRPDLKID